MLSSRKKELLGTQVQIIINNEDQILNQVFDEVFVEVQKIEQKYSRFIKNNELYHLNSNLNKWIGVSDELFYILEIGKLIEEKTNGTFSLSVKSILDSWGYNENYELDKYAGNGDTGELLLNKNKKEVYLNAQIEIGAIGKGYALDKMVEKLKEFKNVFINAGGDIYAKGKDDNGNKWKIFLQHPLDSNRAIGEIEITDGFLAGSSPIHRRWGNKHHLINALEKKPANNMFINFVLSNSGILADGYSTALFSMGFENAKELIKKNSLKALIISPKEEIYMSEGFMCKLY